MSAPRVVVVSLRKSGTHLVREVVRALGYQPHGDVNADPTARLPLDRDDVLRMLRAVYPGPQFEELSRHPDRGVVDAAVSRALAAMDNAWRVRLGMAPHPAGSPRSADPVLLARALADPGEDWFDRTPVGLCWFVHQLDLARVDPGFLRRWAVTGQPRLVLNYRDPRDTLLSMVNFLGDRPMDAIGDLADHRVYAGVLAALPDLPARIDLALTDPCFPGADAFERATWLLHHPRVHTVSYEQLVGPRGGGSAQAQVAAIAALADFVGAEVDAEQVARTVYDPGSFTFASGRVGGWRKAFSRAQTEAFAHRYGTMLDLYGYR